MPTELHYNTYYVQLPQGFPADKDGIKNMDGGKDMELSLPLQKLFLIHLFA